MPESPQGENPSAKAATTTGAQAYLHAGCSHGAASPCSGFALVVVLLFLAILLGGIAVLASFVTLSQRSGSAQRNADSAQQSALFGLNIALGELQAAAGPDQRVTAPASILGNSTYTGNLQPIAGQTAWTGVWKSNTGKAPNGDPVHFNPATPDTKSFVGWLVSATDAGGNFTIPAALSAPTSNSTLTANQTRTLFSTPDGTPYIQAGKVRIDDVPGGRRYFAFAVEDEGVKADFAWSETPVSSANNTSERAQASRLSAAPGPDYAALNGTNGPFSSLTYPLTIASPSFLSSAIAPMRDPADLQVSMNATASWLKDQRANITWGSMGILSDVKKGGLRRDLSLAFEMDGTAEAENATKFNQQAGEFVGNGDSFSAPQKPAGLPVNERFLWRDYAGSGTPFSGSITAGTCNAGRFGGTYTRRLRGPNWWALRDYANLYKRLSGTGGDYTMAARAYFPNRSSERLAYSDYHSAFYETQTWDVEIGTNDVSTLSSINTLEPASSYYYYRPARANYAPVNLGTSVLVSILAKNVTGIAPDQRADLAIALDPLFYFWNPYNRKIRCENIAVVLGAGLPGRAVFDVKTSTGTVISSWDLSLAALLKNNVTYQNGDKLIFLIKGPFVLEPGEVVVASPIAAPTGGVGTGEAILGYATNNTSGIIITKLGYPSPFPPINVRLDDQVSFSFLRIDHINYGTNNASQNAIRHEMDTSLPGAGVTPQSLAANMTALGEQTQHNLQVLWAGSTGIEDQYVSPAGVPASTTKVRTETVSALVDTKVIFGAHSLLIKPASPGGAGIPKPHEIFSRFNPVSWVMKRDYYSLSNPNQIYRHVTASSTFAVLNDSGIDFSGAARNTFWGLSYQSNASIIVPASNIPSSPLFSLASLSNANLSIMGTDPFHAVGNSWSNPLIPPTSAYANVNTTAGIVTAQDFSWLINDSLFDRYYLSGMAPAFTIDGGGYSAAGMLADTLTSFFSANFTSALANPVLRPYLPPGQTATAAIAELAADDGYKKLGAYSLIAGAFNVNSTSVSAWTAFLRANRDLAVDYAQGAGSDTATGSPFPGSQSPSAPGNGPNGPKPQWSGFSRFTDAQITALATRIVAQVKLRGPFMSLSDFINHKMGTVDAARSYTGALQAALDLEAGAGVSGINADSRAAAGGTAPTYTSFNGAPVLGTNTKVTTGIPGDITQASLLLPLAPRLAARSDTFRIRSYGEVRSTDGSRVISQATCEAIVQRVPEYMDPLTDAANNEPWDEGAGLNQTNKTLGRRFKVVSFRWLSPNEI